MNTIVNQANDVAVPTRDRSRAFGSILVEHGRLTPADAEEIQRYAGSHGLRFGEAALKLKLLTQQDIDFAVAQQFNYPILQRGGQRSEEHTSELQSRLHLVCRLLLEKKK